MHPKRKYNNYITVTIIACLKLNFNGIDWNCINDVWKIIKSELGWVGLGGLSTRRKRQWHDMKDKQIKDTRCTKIINRNPQNHV